MHAQGNAGGNGEAVLHIAKPGLFDLVETLRKASAAPVSATAPTYVFEARNPALDRLLATIDGRAVT